MGLCWSMWDLVPWPGIGSGSPALQIPSVPPGKPCRQNAAETPQAALTLRPVTCEVSRSCVWRKDGNNNDSNQGFPGGSVGKDPPAVQETRVQSLVRKIPTPVFWPGKFHGQRNLAGYSPWSCKELDTTEHTCTQIWEKISPACSKDGVMPIHVREGDLLSWATSSNAHGIQKRPRRHTQK